MKTPRHAHQHYLMLAVLFILLPVFVYAQANTTDDKFSNYDRSSLSLLLLNYQNNNLPNAFKAKFNPKISEKFFANPILNNTLAVGFERFDIMKTINSPKDQSLKDKLGNLFSSKGKAAIKVEEQIRQALEEQNAGWGIIKIWSQQDASGNFKTLRDRVDYNFSAVKEGENIDPKKMENIKPLFKRNYILVFDFNNLNTIQNYYREKNLTVDDDDDGIMADATVYFYRLDVDDALFDGFIKTNFNQPDSLKKKTYPIAFERKYVAVVKQKRPKSQLLGDLMTDEELYEKLIQKVQDKACSHLEMKMDGFKAKCDVLELAEATKLKGTIGKREGVQLDQRFYIYEKQYNEQKNSTAVKRVAMLRATHNIANNITSIKDDEGNYLTTVFRKTYGGSIEPGMQIVQEKDLGLSVAAGMLSRSSTTDFGIRLAYNISPLLYKFKESINFSGTRFFIDIAFGKRPSDDLGNEIIAIKEDKTRRIGFGFSKDLLLHHIVDVVPYIAYYSYTFGEDDLFNHAYLKLGARIPVQVYYNIFLVADLGVTTEKDITNVSRFPIGASLRMDF